MGASTGIFNQTEVAVMVAVVLLTTLITPLILRGAFAIHCPQDSEESDSSEDAGEPIDVTEYSMTEIRVEI
jgi:hypothetical protein